MHITVDEQSCVGAGQCVLSVPEVFDQDERTGRVVLLAERPPATLHGDVLEAARACPAQAITPADD
ncbi:ferredoxin [Streptomyces longispororuber]|uniref:Ferredoxin n=1 Tax=Streptomyces longispororuber TaxID=68230 RepID=A0A918ZU43_9ACTN|nr:ferredoxin [Streptomyces longispororuber]GHE70125.1 ferredoxin [Streptomyces longispororuber]